MNSLFYLLIVGDKNEEFYRYDVRRHCDFAAVSLIASAIRAANKMCRVVWCSKITSERVVIA